MAIRLREDGHEQLVLTDAPLGRIVSPLFWGLFTVGVLTMFWWIVVQNGLYHLWWLLLPITLIVLLYLLFFWRWVVNEVRTVHLLRVVFDRRRALITRVERYPWLRLSRTWHIPFVDVQGAQIQTETDDGDGVPCHTLLLTLRDQPSLMLQTGPPRVRWPHHIAVRINGFLESGTPP